VTLALGVPTVWLMLLQHVERNRSNPKRDLVLRLVIGAPRRRAR
jgi:hypothetical protein